MKNDGPTLSSEQALDDYFSALLLDDAAIADEGVDELSAAHMDVANVYEQDFIASQSQNDAYEQAESYAMPMAELQWQPTTSSLTSSPALQELQAPNLEDVERLLSQLESTNAEVDFDIDHILASNTQELSASQASVEEVVETKLTSVVLDDDEIQTWDIENSETEYLDVIGIDSSATLDAPCAIAQELDAIAEAPRVDDAALTSALLETDTGQELPQTWQFSQRDSDFQVLYFEVNGVTFAVPLDELGGIHRLATLNHLLGRPDWYLGLQTSREQQLDVVDTAKWAMPERLDDETYREDYQYIVMLGVSTWGLASSQLLGTEWLSSDSVRWREQAGKRPWLAGMVKEKMCALIHVDAMINMLSAGLDVKSLK
ncbi:chemotaxis protein CheW [Vibrio sp. SM6]|uniref:Chemotaxis protein CheW n=1 Tax=Vibrio agarilyticus TaxID=2726741 RepID=A0A7X8TQY6_9VIBR|nr:chemotaxis protein CheW [Vibrio agarilyticus]NLS13250.1 chemotaxis protein CheW [Vibrio agarilyticus]